MHVLVDILNFCKRVGGLCFLYFTIVFCSIDEIFKQEVKVERVKQCVDILLYTVDRLGIYNLLLDLMG
jgi:hypothetical protein